jgi:hydrogenase maturation protease
MSARFTKSEMGLVSKPTLILGIGNYLMGDEGVGVHAVRRLESEQLPEGVELIDGGTGGFHLLSFFHNYDPLILIDATMDGLPPGTVRMLTPKFASDFPRSLGAHDIGLRDLIESAVLTRDLPRILLVTVSIERIESGTILSPAVQFALDKVAETVMGIVEMERHRTRGGSMLNSV